MGQSLRIMLGLEKPPGTPATMKNRITNIFVRHFRGILGTVVPFAAFSWQGIQGDHPNTIKLVWFTMTWLFFIQPFAIPVTATLPIFLLPSSGIMSSVETCKLYFSDQAVLMIVGGMLFMLFNCSRLDRRIAMTFLGGGSYSPKALLIRGSLASFILSLVSNRQLAAKLVIDLLTPAMNTIKSRKPYAGEPNYTKVQHVVTHAITSSASIGSLFMIHGSFQILAARLIMNHNMPLPMFKKFEPGAATEAPPPRIRRDYNSSDMLRDGTDPGAAAPAGEAKPAPPADFVKLPYISYLIFAFVLAVVLFILNLLLNFILMIVFGGGTPHKNTMATLKKDVAKNKEAIPKAITCHEVQTIIAFLIITGLLMARHKIFGEEKLSDFHRYDRARVEDASIVTGCIIILHCLPKTLTFLRIFTNCDCKINEMKPESSWIFWRFVNGHTNYGWIFILGALLAMVTAMRQTKMEDEIDLRIGQYYLNKFGHTGTCIIACLLGAVASNLMNAGGAVVVLLPLFYSMRHHPEWYLLVLSAAVGCHFGFCVPFKYTPTFYNKIVKMPFKSNIILGLVPSILCAVLGGVIVALLGPALL